MTFILPRIEGPAMSKGQAIALGFAVLMATSMIAMPAMYLF
ncbi:hypothetical protein OB905_07625 [Halobacteria archaeon AArc-dxtr1]|nr:hypothetical protein [Halobacteria archaeon AArc-dxtr1]